MSDSTDLGNVTESLLVNEGRLYDTPGLSDHLNDYRGEIRNILAADDQYRRDRSELRGRADMLPREGFERLERESLAEARSRVEESSRRAQQALGKIQSSLEEQALPRLPEGREGPARDEVLLALGTGRPHEVLGQMSHEARAVLLGGEWGRSALRSVGIEDAAGMQKELRSLAIATAAQDGAAEQKIAAVQLLKLGKLAAALGSATSKFELTVRQP